MTLYVTLDPASVKAADDREWRERKAGSSIVSIHRTSAEQLTHERVLADRERRARQMSMPRQDTRTPLKMVARR